VTSRWYGEKPAFREALEGPALARYGRHLTVALHPDHPHGGAETSGYGPLVFKLDNLSVRGRDQPERVEVWFRADVPIAQAAGIPESEFPSVYDQFDSGPHRHGDGGLCLYYAYDPPTLRWTPDQGLPALFDMASEHLYFEDYYHRNGGVWLGREAPHGFPGERARRDAFGREAV
jgi:hypothetical protein